MRDFVTALQFLTRIHVVDQKDLTIEDFGRSVKMFPLVGLVLGLIAAGAAWLLLRFLGPVPLTAAVLTILPIVLTGGLHADGFMDTMDGVLSCRDRARMLEIMKDSRVGSMGVAAFVCLMLLDFGAVWTIAPAFLPEAVLAAPIVARTAVVASVAGFPYARNAGMGKEFAEYATGRTVAFAFGTALLLFVAGLLSGATSVLPFAALAIGFAAQFALARYYTRILGGLTGDVYGTLITLTETATLLAYAVFSGPLAL